MESLVASSGARLGAARAAAMLVLLGAGLISTAAQPPDNQPMPKPFSPALERFIQSMPPSAQPTIRQMLESDPNMRRRIEAGDRQMQEKRPHWTRETVLRKIKAVFPDSDPAPILNMLEQARLSYRVQLAIIKLCYEGKGIAALAHNVKVAKTDFRDVLAWAESPNGVALSPSASDTDREAADDRDHHQYLRWIEQDRAETR